MTSLILYVSAWIADTYYSIIFIQLYQGYVNSIYWRGLLVVQVS